MSRVSVDAEALQRVIDQAACMSCGRCFLSDECGKGDLRCEQLFRAALDIQEVEAK
jgi:hypothetical protein